MNKRTQKRNIRIESHEKFQRLPPTVNLHNLVSCNYNCGFCYAGFPGVKQSRLSQEELHATIRAIASAPLPPSCTKRKVTFAGGEPLLSRTVLEDIAFAKSLGLVTSLVTNGSLLTLEKLEGLAENLDWLTLSIDSVTPDINRAIGRHWNQRSQGTDEYLSTIVAARDRGIRIKINTVVNRKNVNEDLSPFILEAHPLRWKILQVTRVEEENGGSFDAWVVEPAEFRRFVTRHQIVENDGIQLVAETDEDIRGTYAMVSPDGRFFDSADGHYRFSRPILEAGIDHAFTEVSFSHKRFKLRQGEYDFVTGENINKCVAPGLSAKQKNRLCRSPRIH